MTLSFMDSVYYTGFADYLNPVDGDGLIFDLPGKAGLNG